MKKLSLLLSATATMLLVTAFVFGFVGQVQATNPGGGAKTNPCEYKFNAYGSNGSCACVWNGISGEFCTCGSCGDQS